MQYTSHLDLHKTWERTFRRAGLPLAYSGGFSPHPKLQIAAALPLGFTGEAEVLDFWLETPPDLPAVRAAIERALPPGLAVTGVEEVSANSPALQTLITAAEYLAAITASFPPADLQDRIAALLAAPALPRTWRGKAYDLHPLVESLQYVSPPLPPPLPPGAVGLLMQLAAREGATARPEEVLAALGLDPAAAVYHRRRLIFGAGD